MNNEEKIYALLEKMYIEFSSKFEKIDDRFESLEDKINNIKKIVIDIEHNHGNKLKSLFDGYMQNTYKLDKIENEVSKHEEIIIKKVK